MRTFLLVTVSLLGSLAQPVWAQWQWLDADGRKVFSDRPPPAHIAPHRIVQQPGPGQPRPQPIVDVAPAPSAPAAADNTATSDAAQAAAREREAWLRQRHDNCQRAQAAQVHLQAGVPLSTLGPNGQRTVMTPAQRAQEQARIQAIVQTECGPLPAMKP